VSSLAASAAGLPYGYGWRGEGGILRRSRVPATSGEWLGLSAFQPGSPREMRDTRGETE
jgi:hypothetical protein